MRSRPLLAEFLGTFAIVFAPVAWSGAGGEGGLLAAAIVSALPVTAMIYAFGGVSGAHFNPAVTVALAVLRRFDGRKVPAYLVAQILGGVAAAGVSALFYGPGFGAHIPRPGSLMAPVGIELVVGFLLMLTILAVTSDPKVHPVVPGIAIGATVTFEVLIAGPVSGGSMNPARSIGPALFNAQALPHVWIYILCPIVGMLAAAALYAEGSIFAPRSAKD